MNTETVVSVNAFVTLILKNISNPNSKNFFTLTVGPNVDTLKIADLKDSKLSQIVGLFKTGVIRYHSEIL